MTNPDALLQSIIRAELAAGWWERNHDPEDVIRHKRLIRENLAGFDPAWVQETLGTLDVRLDNGWTYLADKPNSVSAAMSVWIDLLRQYEVLCDVKRCLDFGIGCGQPASTDMGTEAPVPTPALVQLSFV